MVVAFLEAGESSLWTYFFSIGIRLIQKDCFPDLTICSRLTAIRQPRQKVRHRIGR